MERLQKIYEELNSNILDIFNCTGVSWETLEEAMVLLERAMDNATCRITEALVAELQKKFFESEERKTAWVVKERNREKELVSPHGVLRVQNDVYMRRRDADASDGGAGLCAPGPCTSPVLRALGIDPHEKVCVLMRNRLIEGVLDMSYQKAADIIGGCQLSRESVYRYVHGTGPVEMFDPPAELRKAEILDLAADEDHIALQKDLLKRMSAIVPFMVVFEGEYKEGKGPDCIGRMRLLNPKFFVNPDLDPKALKESVRAYIESTYDMSVLKKVRVHGDGGAWIKNAFKDAAFEVEHVLDGFHLEREIRRLARRMFVQKAKQTAFKEKLVETLKANNKESFDELADGQMKLLTDAQITKNCARTKKYIDNNWDAAAARHSKDMPGSCTEAMVQHLLSERLSTIPRSWSRKGAGIIASLRAARLNGVDVTHPKPEERQTGGYVRHLQQLIAKEQRRPIDWSVFDTPASPVDGNSGTQHLMRLIANSGQLALA